MVPFYADQGYLSNFQIKNKELDEEITSESAASRASKLRRIMSKLQIIMTSNNQKMGHRYNSKHKKKQYSVGDWEMLKTTHIRSLRRSNKLAEKHIGLFKIISKVTDQTYQLDLKNLVGKVHDFLCIEKLEKFKRPQEDQHEYGIEWFIDDEVSCKTIKNISDLRVKNGVFEYQVIYSDKRKEWIPLYEFYGNNV